MLTVVSDISHDVNRIFLEIVFFRHEYFFLLKNTKIFEAFKLAVRNSRGISKKNIFIKVKFLVQNQGQMSGDCKVDADASDGFSDEKSFSPKMAYNDNWITRITKIISVWCRSQT